MSQYFQEQDFESLLRSRLQEHQQQLDKHRIDVSQKIEWLTPGVQPGPYIPEKYRRVNSIKPRDNKECFQSKLPISNLSEKLAVKRRVEEGVQNLRIEDSLIYRGEKNKTKKWLQGQSLTEAQVPAKPTITEFASSIPPSSVIETTNRLSRPSMTDEKILLILQKELKELVEENVSTFSPAITPRAKQLARRPNQTAFDDLYQQASKSRDYKIELEEKRLACRDEELKSRTPKVNKMSSLIAERLSETTMERLQRPKSTNFVVPTQQTPRSHSTSRTISLYNDHLLRKQKKLQSELEQIQLEEVHSFTPNIIHSKSVSGTSFLDRQTAWERRKKHNLAQNIEAHYDAEVNECTFIPATNTHKRTVSENHDEGPPPRTEAPTRVEDNVLAKAIEALNRARIASVKAY